MNKLFNLILIIWVLFLIPAIVFAEPGFTGGIIFQKVDTNTITASPTITSTNLNVLTTSNPTLNNFNLTVLPLAPQYNAIKLQGTSVGNASPTADQFYWYSATSTALIPMTISAGSNITFSKTTSSLSISAAGTSLSGNEASGTIHFNTVAPADVNPGTADTTRHTVYLSPTANSAALFGAEILKEDWDDASNMALQILVATPVTAAVATVVFQLQYQILKPGNALYTSSGFTTLATFTKGLSSSTSAQAVVDANLRLLSATFDPGDRVHLLISRSGAHANDTHTDNLHIVDIKASYHR